MSVRSGQSITKVFTLRAFATGAAANGDSLPTGTLYVNGTADAASVTVTNITTGLYKAAVTLPTLAIGDIVDLRINATVSSVTDNAIIWSDTKDILLDSSGDVTFNNTSIATVTTVTNQLTAAQIATGIFQDTTAGDFTVAGSIGKSLFTSGAAPGTAGGLFIAGSNAATTVNITGNLTGTVSTVTTLTNLPAITAGWLTADGIASNAITAAKIATDAIGAAQLAADAVTEIQSGLSTYAGTDTSGTTTLLARLTALRAGYLDNLSAGAVALASGVIVTTNNDKTGYSLTGSYDFAKGTVAVTESYASNGAAPTPIQALMAIHQYLMSFNIATTNYTVTKLDNVTTAFVVTLNSATTPTAASRT